MRVPVLDIGVNTVGGLARITDWLEGAMIKKKGLPGDEEFDDLPEDEFGEYDDEDEDDEDLLEDDEFDEDELADEYEEETYDDDDDLEDLEEEVEHE
jgi:hypothetical protein